MASEQPSSANELRSIPTIGEYPRWFASLSTAESRVIFGPDGDTIRALSVAAGGGRPTTVAVDRALPDSPATLRATFGANGVAVALFLDNWRQVPWRRAEGCALPPGARAHRVPSRDAAGDVLSSPRWVRALFDAGWRADTPPLAQVREAAQRIGEDVGGHHARHLAVGAAGELAQPGRDLHFFLDLMPWLWLGHWPCGWDDARQLPVIY